MFSVIPHHESNRIRDDLSSRWTFEALPLLVRQLFWVYGGYVVLSIVSLGLICLWAAEYLAQQSTLAHAVCTYGALFWGIRLSLQPVLAAGAKPYLKDVRLKIGRHLLTLVFISLTLLYAVAAFY